MRRKLILEISQNTNRKPDEHFAENNNLLRPIATRNRASAQPSVLLRPARNEYSNHCDVADAPVSNRAR
jgi:hypothetical protein